MNSAKRIRFKAIVLLVDAVLNIFNTKKMDDAVEFPGGKINFE